MANCTVSGTLLDPSATALSGITVYFAVQSPTIQADPVNASTATASDGTWSLSLLQGLSGVITIQAPLGNVGNSVLYRFNVNIPTSSSATFSSILVDQ